MFYIIATNYCAVNEQLQVRKEDLFSHLLFTDEEAKMNTAFVKNQYLARAFNRIRLQRGLAFGLIIIAALLAFEIFNYSTTDFALADLLGDLNFMGVRWATILAIAFCGIDFAGIARLFTPEEGDDEPAEVWYLFGAWLLAATMNAMLTWWGISIAILNHESLGNAVIARETMLRAVPIFVAVMVWLIRVLIIGTFSVAGDRLFSQAAQRQYSRGSRSVNVRQLNDPVPSLTPRSAPSSLSASRSVPKPAPKPEPVYSRPEPTYHPVSMAARSSNSNTTQGRR
jgi:hypothetical protein